MTPKEKADELINELRLLEINGIWEIIKIAHWSVCKIISEYECLNIENSFCYKQWKYWIYVAFELNKQYFKLTGEALSGNGLAFKLSINDFRNKFNDEELKEMFKDL